MKLRELNYRCTRIIDCEEDDEIPSLVDDEAEEAEDYAVSTEDMKTCLNDEMGFNRLDISSLTPIKF